MVQVIEQSPVEDKPEESALSTLKKVLFKYGPVIVGYKMADNNYIRYLDGEQQNACTALPDSGEPPEGQNHLMLAVGWTPKYLIMKNSWGTDWGIEVRIYLFYLQLNCFYHFNFFSVITLGLSVSECDSSGELWRHRKGQQNFVSNCSGDLT